MTFPLAMLRADARIADAATRHAFIESVAGADPLGAVRFATCHRAEVTAEPAVIDALQALPLAAHMQRLDGDAAVRHLLRVAVGLESAVLGEDQVLHQLRTAVSDARARGPLSPLLDHLVDVALRAGRQARSWLPADRPSLADVALDRVALPAPAMAAPVLVVGAGSMGGLAARAVRCRGLPLMIASRSTDRARRLAEVNHAAVMPLDPGPGVAFVTGIIVALSGPWVVGPEASDAIARHVPWVIDLSSPPAVDPRLAERLGERWSSIDDLAAPSATVPGSSRTRLEALVDATLAELRTWADAAADRDAARGLAELADAARRHEIASLMTEIPMLDGTEREAVARMTERLVRRLLRDPFARLGHDPDGRYEQAARDLFQL